jgi:hypothetical protein
MYGPSILDNLSYFRVEDTYEMSSVKFLSPMETDPPILPLSPPPANPSPIVGRVLNFDSMDYAAPLQPCSHPRGEDTYRIGDHLMMMMKTEVRTVEKVVKRATMLVS